jgi:hypothetical protein
MRPQPPAQRKRMPRWWVGLLLLLPVLALVSFLPPFARVTEEDALRDVAFRFRVTDAETGRPLKHALIRLFAEEKVVRDLATGPDGEAETTEPCPAAERKTFFSRGGARTVPDWSFFVSALGYKMAGPLFLRNRVGERRDPDDPAPPVIQVRMEKQSEVPPAKH